MPFSIEAKLILPKGEFSKKRYAEAVASAQRAKTVRGVKRLFQKTVFGWSKKPNFGWVQRRIGSTISITMYPTGQYADIWQLVNAGSPPHDIPKRGGGYLRFRTGYRSATRPGQLMSRRAYRSGKYVGATIIKDHPGFKGRNFVQLIADEYRDTFSDEMQEAINKAASS